MSGLRKQNQLHDVESHACWLRSSSVEELFIYEILIPYGSSSRNRCVMSPCSTTKFRSEKIKVPSFWFSWVRSLWNQIKAVTNIQLSFSSDCSIITSKHLASEFIKFRTMMTSEFYDNINRSILQGRLFRPRSWCDYMM